MDYLQVLLLLFGYMKDPNDKYHLIIDDDAANVIRKIFSMYANGQGATKICSYLNESRIPIPSIYKHEKGSRYSNYKIELDKRIRYQVEKEDTIISIANKYQSTVKDIVEYNCLQSEVLHMGQTIIIPVRHVWRTGSIYQLLKNEVYCRNFGTTQERKNKL